LVICQKYENLFKSQTNLNEFRVASVSVIKYSKMNSCFICNKDLVVLHLNPGVESFFCLGSSGNGINAHHGLNHIWSGSNLHQQSSPSNMLWQKTPSFVNGSPGLPQMSSFARTPPHMLRTQHLDHHVGSAPVVTASPWERKNSYLGESPETSAFHLGSPGNGGFHGSWQMRPMEFSAHNNMFSHVGGNGTELSSSAGQSSPNPLSHILYGRQSTTATSKFDPTNERMRNLYSRKSEANTTGNADKKLYELDLGRILRGEDSRTTLMIKNIPNKYVNNLLIFLIYFSCLFHFLSTAECCNGNILILLISLKPLFYFNRLF